MRRRIGRKTGSLILAAALIAASAQPVMAEQGENEAQGQISVRAGEAADMPAVETDEVTWTGGKLKIPVSLGGYSADELIVVLNEKNENGLVISSRLLDIEGENAVCDMVSFVDVTGEEWFAKAGDHFRTVAFESAETRETIAEDDVTIHVPDDSVKWQVSETTLVFDGSQDVVFHFVNGTNCFELEAVDLLGIFTGMGGEGDPVTVVPDMTDGFTCDMAAGTLTIDKDALKETLASAVSYNGGTLPDEIAVNARAVTKDGESFYFNRVPYEGSSTVTNTAWWLDISDLDLDGGTEPAPGWVQVEFAGADGASVSEEDADLISSSALEYLQENYADELAALGEGYEVSVRMDIAERGEENIPDEIKEAFSQAAGGSEIGKYYEISVLADVVSGGEAIDGLEGIVIPSLSREVTVDLKIPAGLQKEGRVYTMLHYSGGKASALETVGTKDTVSFKTASFSPYALAYKDAAGSASAADGNAAPKTGDGTGAAGAMGMMLLTAAVSAVLHGGRKSKENA